MPIGPRPEPSPPKVGRYSRFCETESPLRVEVPLVTPELTRGGNSKLRGPRPLIQNTPYPVLQDSLSTLSFKRSNSSQSSLFSQSSLDSLWSLDGTDSPSATKIPEMMTMPYINGYGLALSKNNTPSQARLPYSEPRLEFPADPINTSADTVRVLPKLSIPTTPTSPSSRSRWSHSSITPRTPAKEPLLSRSYDNLHDLDNVYPDSTIKANNIVRMPASPTDATRYNRSFEATIHSDISSTSRLRSSPASPMVPVTPTSAESIGFPELKSDPNLPTDLLPQVTTPISVNIDLPQAPPFLKSSFSAEQLTVNDLQLPEEIWSLSCLSKWIHELLLSNNGDISVDDMKKALVKLFVYRINTLDLKLANDLATNAINSLRQQRFILESDNQLMVNPGDSRVSGVLTLLCNDGCYANSNRISNIETKVDKLPRLWASCYAPRCGETLNTVRTSSLPVSLDSISSTRRSPYQKISKDTYNQSLASVEMNWRKFWLLEERDLSNIDPKVVKLQFALHELIMSEVLYVEDLETYLDVYGDLKLMQGFSIMNDQESFVEKVFGRISKVLATNKEMLNKLLNLQYKEGPYLNTSNVSDIVTEWSCLDQTSQAYINYANDYLSTETHLRQELSQNVRTKTWMEERGKNPKLQGKPHSFFFHRVLPRVARYQLLLNAILKYVPDNEVSALHRVNDAIAACNELTQKCDDCVAKQKRISDVQSLKAHIVFKSPSVMADLELSDKRRRLVYRGDVQRRGELKMEWVSTHILLLDNFMVLSKKKDGQNGTAFYITKHPIPLDLLVIENGDEEGVVKLTTRLTITRLSADDTATSNSVDDNSMFPLSITHLGYKGQKYVLYISSKAERQQWIQSIVNLQESRARLALASSTEAFALNLITDGFAYPDNEIPHLPIPIPHTLQHRSLSDANGTVQCTSRVVLRRRVNCFAVVQACYFMGTDLGLWFFNTLDDKPWRKILGQPGRIVKIEILESMNAVFILCGERNLTWFPLDQLIARGLGDDRKSIGMRLNQHRKIIDFSVSVINKAIVVVYVQQNGMVKVMEPVYSYGALGMRNLTMLGIKPASRCIDSFRELDRFQASSDVTNVDVFSNSMIFATSKSFEWLSLNTKSPIKLPVGNVSTISKDVNSYGKPLKVFRIDSTHLLLCYDSSYIVCDNSGKEVSQAPTWFLDKNIDAAYVAPYLVVLSDSGEFIEILTIGSSPGKSVQVITGKDMSFTSTNSLFVTIKMAHPWVSGRQVIFQLDPKVINRNPSSSSASMYSYKRY